MFNFFKKVPSITTNELEERIKTPVTLLDVRSPEEYQSGHIPVARNIPLDAIRGFKGKKEAPIYVICQSGMRSKQACGVLASEGYDVINVQSGMNQWHGQVKRGR